MAAVRRSEMRTMVEYMRKTPVSHDPSDSSSTGCGSSLSAAAQAAAVGGSGQRGSELRMIIISSAYRPSL